jgi:hypothetical protein
LSDAAACTFKYPVGDGFAKTGTRLAYPRLRGMWKQQVGHSLFLLPSVKVYRPTESGGAVSADSAGTHQRRVQAQKRVLPTIHTEVSQP